ncbi:BT4734/BF3469 family protein [Algoriphagus taiwanensis]|uniref:BT4734-like N-terminal domain-containing protein n=1 Tax=Algoriphagus taiwanensis TaxID=1445656 RepID=A0ABQ6PVG1_9BACT|nr:hypothetical protein Ataiwa_02260 [Algoriphagus taiwanensis]
MENLRNSVLNVQVSCFQNYNTTWNPVSINLMTWLTSRKYKDRVEAIRSIEDKKQRDALKSTLPCITPSGTFSYRSQSNLINHSGLIQIDLDLSPKNQLITNWEDLKSELVNLSNIAYLGKSVSGTGYWGLIPIPPDPENHARYFDALFEKFLKNWGIELDTRPKNVASLRGYSFDDEPYFNHNPKKFLLKKEAFNFNRKTFKINQDESGLEQMLINRLENAQPGEMHSERLKVARLAGGYVAAGRLDARILDKLIENYLNNFSTIDNKSIQKKEIKALRDGFENGLRSPLYD